MAQDVDVDAALITWGDRLFYPGNRIVKSQGQPRPKGHAARHRAAIIRQRIEATVVRRAPQVMVKVTGGGRGMKAIAAHLRYISKNGRLEIEDQNGQTLRGKDSVRDLADEWRLGGSRIPDDAEPGHRREAFNIMLSMPRGTDPLTVQWAARAFAKTELADHTYVMVLHDHQANPHVHLSVRAESRRGRRLNPRNADLQRWRETFAQKLRERGVETEATRQATRGQSRKYDVLWRLKAQEDGRLRSGRQGRAVTTGRGASRQALDAWRQIGGVLGRSDQPQDKRLGQAVATFVDRMEEVQHRTMETPGRDPVSTVQPSGSEQQR